MSLLEEDAEARTNHFDSAKQQRGKPSPIGRNPWLGMGRLEKQGLSPLNC
jgi:hypothetical protein